MTDIVRSLRSAASHPDAGPGTCRLLIAEALEAAKEIERLRAENERLREALEPFAKAAEIDPEQCFAYGGIWSAAGATGYISVAHLRRARATLEGK